MNDREGPKVTIHRSCQGCKHERSEYYAVQGDSGHTVTCDLVKRTIGDTTWDTPAWCPLAVARTHEPTLTNRSIKTRFIVQVGGCREIWQSLEQAVHANPDRSVFREDIYHVYAPNGEACLLELGGPEVLRKC